MKGPAATPGLFIYLYQCIAVSRLDPKRSANNP
jgi:hypothetical protein